MVELFGTQKHPTQKELDDGFWRVEGERYQNNEKFVEPVKVKEVKSEEVFWNDVDFGVSNDHVEALRCIKMMGHACEYWNKLRYPCGSEMGSISQ